MNDKAVALDAGRAIAVLNDTAGAGDWVRQFTRVLLPVPVVGQLRFAALNSSRRVENLEHVHALVARCQVLGADQQTAFVYADIRLGLKRSGNVIPEHDIWISAICIQHWLPLATVDPHFACVGGLTVIND